MFSERFLARQAMGACLSLLIGAFLLFFAGYQPFAFYPEGNEVVATVGVVFVVVSLFVYVWASVGLMKNGYQVADSAPGDSVSFTLITMLLLTLVLLMKRVPHDGWYSWSIVFQDIALIAALCGFMAVYGFGYNEEERERRRADDVRRIQDGEQTDRSSDDR